MSIGGGCAPRVSGPFRSGFDLGSDVRAPEFVAEAHRQSMAIAASEGESDDQAFVDAISVEAGDDPESAE